MRQRSIWLHCLRAGPDLLVVLVLSLLAALFLNVPHQQMIALRIGANDREVITGFHMAEISSEDGRTFRWTDGRAVVRLAAQGFGPHILRIRLAAPQSPAPAQTSTQVTFNGRMLATLSLHSAPRQYTFLVHDLVRSQSGNSIGLESAVFQIAGDKRNLGVVAFEAALTAPEQQHWLVPTQVAALALALLALLLIVRWMGIGPARWLIGVLFLAISLSMRHSDSRFLERWNATQLSFAIAALCLLAALPALWMARRYPPEPTPNTDSRSTQSSWRLPTLVFAILSALLFIPFLPIGQGIPGPAGDNFEYVWKLQWFADALTNRHTAAFVPQIFFPIGYELAYSEMTPAHTLLGLPLTLVFGPEITYMLLLYLTYVLTGLFTTLLAERLGAPRIGALLAGIGVAFCLYRYQHLLGHLPLMSTQWIVLALYGLEGFFLRRQARDALLIGLGAALAAWSSWYYGPTLLLLLALYALVRWPWRETHLVLGAWRKALVVPIVLVALLAPYAQPYLDVQERSSNRHSRNELLPLSAQPIDYLAPSRYHPLWGAWSAQAFPETGGERLIMPGLCLLALAAIGIWRSRRYRAAQALLVISIASVIISLGPQLTIGGLTIWMPVDFIYDHVPILQSIRAWVRIAFYVQIGIALLAGLSFVGFGSLGRSRQVLLCLLAFGVICESISAPLWLSPSGPQPSDRWLAAQPGHGAVVSVPNIYSGANQYAALFHQHPLLIGYGTFTPPGSFEDSSMIMRFPAQVSITTMQRLGAEFVLVRNDLMDREQPGWREDTQQRLGAAPAYQDASVTIYRLHKIIP